MILADKIILLRKKCGWSQEQLAEQLGISRQSVSKWESGMSIPDLVKKVSFKIAFSIFSMILAVIPLIILGGISEYKIVEITEDMAGGYGVEGIVNKRKDAYADIYRRNIVIGIALCVLGIVPLFIAVGMDKGDFAYVCCVGILLIFIAVGTVFFVTSGMIWDSFNKLLQLDDYTREKKKNRRKYGFIAGVYWCVVTAIFLAFGFIFRDWGNVGLIWPVAGVLFGAVVIILNAMGKKDQANS